jgi:chitinase
MPTAKSSRYNLFFLLLAQLIWAVPTCSRVTPSHRSLSNSVSNWPGLSKSVAAAWYAGWHSSDFTLQDLSWCKYSMVFWAFAVTTPDVNVLNVTAPDAELLPQFVQTAHENNVTAIMTIGGWAGSQYFSSAMATDANRTAFAQTVMNLVSTYKLDGVEIDWEFPAEQEILEEVGCNVVSVNDSVNLLAFLQTLRSQDGAEDLIITAAVTVTPFIGSDGNPMTDVSEFAKVLDYIEILNFDIWGPWSNTVGPNAPLYDTCAPAADQASHRLVTLSTSTKVVPSTHRAISICTRHSTSLSNPRGMNGTILREALMSVAIRMLLASSTFGA